ncbi:hypothetical protein [Aliterella atlantica]|uniref:Uncharacterized protein n=1 Tax=Aliterella atlantica CENA595 TaxID=1618023 RepID=A0A0D8ZX08_9CYAN|nr:hypothetical protein [Aliterella atlantica]KJH73298.1 hypothetical protein UH38_00390 [Aliterella atlantica CENA595]
MTRTTDNIAYRSCNPGDRILPNQTLEEKANQLAVDAPDITGDRITVPTYFIIEYPDGEKQALHHVKDAKKISSLIQQMALNESYIESKSAKQAHFINWTGMILLGGLLVLTVPILVGIF